MLKNYRCKGTILIDKNKYCAVYMKKIIIYIIIGALLLIIGYILGRSCDNAKEDTTIVQRDTTIVRDTVEIEKPVPVKVTQKETLFVAATDTLRIKDTLYITLPKEVKVYANEDYYAEVSGYQPSLDYLEIYSKQTTITQTERLKDKKNRLAFGIEGGWCQTFSAPVYLEYSRKLHRYVELEAGVFRDFVKKENGVRFGIEAQIGW